MFSSLYRRIKRFQIIFEIIFSMLSLLQKYKQEKKLPQNIFLLLKICIIKWIFLKMFFFYVMELLYVNVYWI